MRNNPIYKRLRKIAVDGGYTIAQIANASYTIIREKLGGTYQGTKYELPLPETFIDNMKDLLIRQLQPRDDEADKQFLIANVDLPALRARFTNLEIERERVSNVRKITLWLDGKPTEEIL